MEAKNLVRDINIYLLPSVPIWWHQARLDKDKIISQKLQSTLHSLCPNNASSCFLKCTAKQMGLNLMRKTIYWVMHCKYFARVYKEWGRSSQKWENYKISAGNLTEQIKPEVPGESHTHTLSSLGSLSRTICVWAHISFNKHHAMFILSMCKYTESTTTAWTTTQ